MTNEEFQELVLTELKKHSEQFDSMNGKINAIQGAISGINGEINGIKSGISGINGQISGIKSEISGINGQISGINGQISGIKSEINGINGEINGINGEISGIKSKISGINGEVSEIKIQLDESTQILKAIRHNQEVSNARLEGIELTTAKIESVHKVQREVDVLGSKVYDLAIAK